MRHLIATFLCTLVLLPNDATGSEEYSSTAASDRQSLSALQSLIGSWRGVGQPQRGSTKGAWIEQADWAWHFSESHTSVRFATPKGKYFLSGVIRSGAKPGELQLSATRANSTEPTIYRGAFLKDGRFEFVSASPPDGYPARISIRLVAQEKRMLVLYERKLSSDRYFRMAEVGLTRKGSGFGSGTSRVECVVTGGLGTIPVKYEGRTYYVCCTGCRDHFNEDPATVLAEYQQRKQKAAKKP